MARVRCHKPCFGALLLLLATGCAAADNAAADNAAGGPTAIECGRRVPAVTGGAVALTARFPPVVSSGESGVTGIVEVTNGTGVVRGVVTAGADVFLVRNGRIVTLPVPQDLVGVRLELPAGKMQTLPAQATLSPCDPGGSSVQGSLRAGTYELYARLVVNHDDGSSTESVRGPWPLEVR